MQSSKLYVGNFSYSTTDEQLEKLFAEYGTVVSASVIGNKGFGFVEMSNAEEAEKAKDALKTGYNAYNEERKSGNDDERKSGNNQSSSSLEDIENTHRQRT